MSSIEELSRRSIRGAKTGIMFKSKKEKRFNFSSWLFCLCSTRSINPVAESQINNPPSLGQYLEVERRAATNGNRRNLQSTDNNIYGPEFELAETNIEEPNSLFVNGSIAPPAQSLSPTQSIETERESMELRHENNGFGSFAGLFSCMCGRAALG